VLSVRSWFKTSDYPFIIVVIVLSVRSWFKTSLITPLVSWSLYCLNKGVIRSLKSRTDRQYNDHDNKGVIRSLKSRTDRQYNDHDNKGVIISLKSRTDRQHNDHDNKGGLLITPLVLWSLCCLSVLDLRLLWLPLYYRGHCIVCPFLINGQTTQWPR
jgi:hypothetical protein